MKRFAPSIGFVFVFVSGVSFGAEKAKATKEQLSELGDIVVGEWVGETTMDFAIEGVCKKGDKLSFKSSVKWVSDFALVDKRVFQVAGKTVAEAAILIGLDYSKGQIKATAFNSVEGRAQIVWTKRGGKWRLRSYGVLRERKASDKGTLIVSEDGNSYTVKVTDRILGEEQLPDKEFVYRRK